MKHTSFVCFVYEIGKKYYQKLTECCKDQQDPVHDLTVDWNEREICV